jgi:nucleoside-diphosphate-sugar epimerase
MTVLVTGAGGFIGSAIARELAKRGHVVIALMRNRPDSPNFSQIVLQDLQDAEATVRLLDDIRCDVIVHAAARMAGVSRDAREADYKVNDNITQNLLSGVSKHPPCFFLCVSSIDVYASTGGVIDETARIAPDNDYAISKFATEKLCQVWTDSRNVGLGIARLTQIFGPGDRTGKLIPMALSAIKTGRPVKLFGDGEDRRDYLFIRDAARMIADWTERRIVAKLNLATGESRSVNEVLELLRTINPMGVRVEQHPRQKPRRDYLFNIAQLIRTLGPFRFTPFSKALRTAYDSMT